MEFYKVLEERHSCRAFLEKEVEQEKLDRILDATISAPSAGNLQSYKIYAIKSKETRSKLVAPSVHQTFLAEAPVVLVFCANAQNSASKYGSRGESLYAVQDATIAAAYAQLAITAEGLASVWIGAFNPDEISRIIGAKSNEIPVAIIPIGYKAEESEIRSRKTKDQIIKEM